MTAPDRIYPLTWLTVSDGVVTEHERPMSVSSIWSEAFGEGCVAWEDYATIATEKERRVERLEGALRNEREENLWNAYATGSVKDGQWSHNFMSDGEWLAEECGLDASAAWHDADEVKALIPEAAERFARAALSTAQEG
jgi:hypothetical protein